MSLICPKCHIPLNLSEERLATSRRRFYGPQGFVAKLRKQAHHSATMAAC